MNTPERVPSSGEALPKNVLQTNRISQPDRLSLITVTRLFPSFYCFEQKCSDRWCNGMNCLRKLEGLLPNFLKLVLALRVGSRLHRLWE